MESPLFDISAAFSKELYTLLVRSQPGNFVFSPCAIQSLLTFISYGTDHETNTQKELLKGLKLPEGMTDAAQIFEQFHKKIRESNVDLPCDHNRRIKPNINFLKLSTRLYLMKGYKPKPSLKELAVNSFNLEVENIDLSKNVEAAGIINEWVYKQPNSKIKRLIEPSLDGDSRMIGVTAVNFKAFWRSKFLPADTFDFYLNETEKVKAKIFGEVDMYKYAFLGELNAHALKMQYMSSEVRMIVLLPVEIDGLRKLEENLHIVNFVELNNQFQTVRTTVSLPKFKIETDVTMKKALKEMGLIDMFTDDANFNELLEKCDDPRPLKLGDIYQRANITVDEEGSGAEDAPFTLHFKRTIGPLPTPVDFFADHPFMFIMMNKDAVIFMGRVTNPTL